LLQKMKSISFPKWKVVILENSTGDAMYLIKSGSVEVFAGEGKNKVKLATLKEGDIFGEISLLSGKNRTATVRTLEPSELFKLDSKDFFALVKKSPKVKGAIERIVEQRAAKTVDAIRSATGSRGSMLV